MKKPHLTLFLTTACFTVMILSLAPTSKFS